MINTIENRELFQRKEFITKDVFQIKLFLPGDFHLLDEEMIQFLMHLTEVGEMEVFEKPVTLDHTNYKNSPDGVPHYLGGNKRPHDENGVFSLFYFYNIEALDLT